MVRQASCLKNSGKFFDKMGEDPFSQTVGAFSLDTSLGKKFRKKNWKNDIEVVTFFVFVNYSLDRIKKNAKINKINREWPSQDCA